MSIPYRWLCVLAITCVIFSCNKELSNEDVGGPVTPPPPDTVFNWQFQDSGRAANDFISGFSDTAFLQTEGDLQALFFEGSTPDRTKGIVFQVIGQPLQVGDYSGEQVSFGYFDGSALVYTNIGASSDFLLKIRYLAQDSVSATFSGHVVDASGKMILLNNGFFNSRIGSVTQNNDSVGNLICSSIAVTGDLQPGVATDFSNYVDMQVHVTKVGTYTFETPVVNGVLFSTEQTFEDTGTFDVRMSAYGTPEEIGSFDYPVIFGNTTCSFNINIDAASETLVDGISGTLARQIRDQNVPATGNMRYYQTLGQIGEIQSDDDPLRKIFYNQNNQLSSVQVLLSDGSGGYSLSETRKYSYNAEGFVSAITRVDENGNFIDSVSTLTYVPSTDKLASRTIFTNGTRSAQLYYTYANGNLTQLVRVKGDYSAIVETLGFQFSAMGNGISTLHPQFYFLDMATFFEEGNYPEVLYFSQNLPIARISGSASTPIDVQVNPSLRPKSVAYNGVIWYRYEYN